MYEELAKNVMVVVKGKWIRTTAILTKARGGLQVHYTDDTGAIVKRQAYSTSSYGRAKKAK